MVRAEKKARSTSTAVKLASEDLFSQLAQFHSGSARLKFLARHRTLLRVEVVERLAQLVVERVRVDTRQAVHLAEAAVLIGRRLRRKETLALGLRAKANALYACGNNAAAVEYHERAVELYDALKFEKEAARTLSSAIQPLILLGEYDKAFKTAGRERSSHVSMTLGVSHVSKTTSATSFTDRIASMKLSLIMSGHIRICCLIRTQRVLPSS